MSYGDQEVKASCASEKHSLSSSHRQGNGGRGEAWQPFTKPPRDVPENWRQAKQDPLSTRLPVFLGTL